VVGSALVIGIGNPDRGDDRAGRAVARLLRETPPPGVEIVEHDGEATSLMACFDGAGAVWLIDASSSSSPPGTVRRFDATAAPLPAGKVGVSSHGLGVSEAIELARALGTLPARCVVYAIEGASFEAGAPLSPEVAAAVAEVGRRVLAEIAETGRSLPAGD